MIRNQNILLISPEPWGTCMVSKHHYAVQLAALGNRVYFLAPNSDFHGSVPEGIVLLTAPKMPRAVRFYPGFWRKTLHRKIGKALEKKMGARVNLLWSFDSSWLFDLQEIAPSATRIFHLVDLSMEFEWKIAAVSADICLGSSNRLKEKLSTLNPRSFFIHHGYTKYPIIPGLLSGEKKKIVYAGNLTISYLDQERLLKLVDAYGECEFHLIGDRGDGNLSQGRSSAFIEDLGNRSNVFLHDSVSPEALSSYYAAADVLLLCYDPRYREQISNPHKVMEYLGSGKPILSTYLEEYTNQEDLIYMRDDVSEYIEGLQELLEERDPIIAERRKAFAHQNTYLEQLQRIGDLIKPFEP